VGLLRRGEQVFAFSATCPHAGVALCTGWLDAMGRIVCPGHKYRFDPSNGRNTSGEGYKLVTDPVTYEDGNVLVGFLT
jgi:3-phenylpropionate/trans-cinnamate dioxygenase ferredoxin subunit